MSLSNHHHRHHHQFDFAARPRLRQERRAYHDERQRRFVRRATLTAGKDNIVAFTFPDAFVDAVMRGEVNEAPWMGICPEGTTELIGKMWHRCKTSRAGGFSWPADLIPDVGDYTMIMVPNSHGGSADAPLGTVELTVGKKRRRGRLRRVGGGRGSLGSHPLVPSFCADSTTDPHRLTPHPDSDSLFPTLRPSFCYALRARDPPPPHLKRHMTRTRPRCSPPFTRGSRSKTKTARGPSPWTKSRRTRVSW